MKVVLTVAGTDPSGAAGIQADLQTIRDHGCHGVSVITTVLAQNTQGVQRWAAISPDLVAAQLDAVFDDFDVAVVKVGLVPNDEVLDVLIAALAGRTVVWDPVLASGDGETTLFNGTLERMVDAVRTATVVTPNVPEVGSLVGARIGGREQAAAAASKLSTQGPAVLLKVGHLLRDEADVDGDGLHDIWAAGGQARDLTGLPAVSDDVRGTGCQLSSALACNLASGRSPLHAAEAARSYLNELLTERGMKLGRGRRLVVRAKPRE